MLQEKATYVSSIVYNEEFLHTIKKFSTLSDLMCTKPVGPPHVFLPSANRSLESKMQN